MSRVVVAAALLVFLVGQSAWAQESVSGRVLDPQGQPISNALVTVTTTPGPSRSVRTGSSGEFQVTGLGGDRAVVQVEAAGFDTFRQPVSLASGTTVNVTLQVAGVREAVNVTGLAPGSLMMPAETGTRLGLSLLETPASVQVISGETIRDRGDATVADAQSRAVGVTSQADPGNGGDSVVARGFGGVGSVMQLFDGDQLFVGAGTVTFPFDTWTVERIEVLGGPASVLYGTGAVGGVVNVVPRKPNLLA